MEKIIKGDIVVLPFPFSDLSISKKRPALVISNPSGDDVLLMQITSKISNNKFSAKINQKDLSDGSLFVVSCIKINRVFSADIKIIEYKLGSLNDSKFKLIQDRFIDFILR